MGEQNKELANYFTEISADFNSKYEKSYDFIVRFAIWKKLMTEYSKERKSAYDFGCGSGIYSMKLAQLGIETVGIEQADGMLELAEELKKSQNLQNISFKKDSLPLKNIEAYPKVDLLIASSVIEYIKEAEEVLLSFKDLLNQKGAIIVSFANKSSVHRWLEYLIFKLIGKPAYLKHVKSRFTENEIRKFAEQNNLKVSEIEYYGRVFRLYSFLSKILGKKLCNTLFVVVLEKKE